MVKDIEIIATYGSVIKSNELYIAINAKMC